MRTHRIQFPRMATYSSAEAAIDAAQRRRPLLPCNVAGALVGASIKAFSCTEESLCVAMGNLSLFFVARLSDVGAELRVSVVPVVGSDGPRVNCQCEQRLSLELQSGTTHEWDRCAPLFALLGGEFKEVEGNSRMAWLYCTSKPLLSLSPAVDVEQGTALLYWDLSD